MTSGQGQTRNVAQYPLHHMTYVSAKFEVEMSHGLGGNALQEIIDLTLTPRTDRTYTQGQGNKKHCSPHYVTNVPAKFEVATTNGKRDAFTRKTLSNLVPKVKRVKVTRNVAIHHVTYVPAKFAVATSRG